jgi:hypothetical protein
MVLIKPYHYEKSVSGKIIPIKAFGGYKYTMAADVATGFAKGYLMQSLKNIVNTIKLMYDEFYTDTGTRVKVIRVDKQIGENKEVVKLCSGVHNNDKINIRICPPYEHGKIDIVGKMI